LPGAWISRSRAARGLLPLASPCPGATGRADRLLAGQLQAPAGSLPWGSDLGTTCACFLARLWAADRLRASARLLWARTRQGRADPRAAGDHPPWQQDTGGGMADVKTLEPCRGSTAAPPRSVLLAPGRPGACALRGRSEDPTIRVSLQGREF